MRSVLIIGDGPLALEISQLAKQAGHRTVSYLYNQHGPESAPLTRLPVFLREMANEVDLTIEAVIASRAEKRRVIELLGEAFIGAAEPILTAALNASASEVGSWAAHPQNVIGWAAIPPLAGPTALELLVGLRTDQDSVGTATEFLIGLGKTPVSIGDTVGGVLPRIVTNLVNEAAFALMEGVAAAEDIDRAMKLGTNYPHGPLAWGDLIGLDQVAGVIAALGEVYGTDRYRPAPDLLRLVHAGMWGQRTGQGFYPYDSVQGSG